MLELVPLLPLAAAELVNAPLRSITTAEIVDKTAASLANQSSCATIEAITFVGAAEEPVIRASFAIAIRIARALRADQTQIKRNGKELPLVGPPPLTLIHAPDAGSCADKVWQRTAGEEESSKRAAF